MIVLFIGSNMTLNDVIQSSFIFYFLFIIYNLVSLTSIVGVIQNFIYFFTTYLM